jgi:predicted DNA-binding transcriptional regulator YafY
MKKYESLFKIMNYVYRHDGFTLRELMTEFSLSKSTALRYVKSLEDIGVPLYSVPGRYGGYKILDTYGVPPITFTPHETYALFFALKTIESIGAMPFEAEYGAIQQKFLQSVSPKIRSALMQIGSRVSFGTAKRTTESPHLENLLLSILDPSVLQIGYRSAKAETTRRIQPIGLFAARGTWYCPSMDIDKQEYRVFRCDRITSIARTNDEPLDALKEIDLSNRYSLLKRSDEAIDYSIELTTGGMYTPEIMNDPRMAVSEANSRIVAIGWIEPSETAYLLQNLHGFGTALLDVHPSFIKDAFIKQLGELARRLQNSENSKAFPSNN